MERVFIANFADLCLDLGCTCTCLHDAELQVAQYLSNCVVKPHWMPSRKMKLKLGDLSE